MEITKELLLDLVNGDDEDGSGWALVDEDLYDTWRWGEDRQVVLRHVETNTVWGTIYRVETSHDNYNVQLDDTVKLKEYEEYMITGWRMKG